MQWKFYSKKVLVFDTSFLDAVLSIAALLWTVLSCYTDHSLSMFCVQIRRWAREPERRPGLPPHRPRQGAQQVLSFHTVLVREHNRYCQSCGSALALTGSNPLAKTVYGSDPQENKNGSDMNYINQFSLFCWYGKKNINSYNFYGFLSQDPIFQKKWTRIHMKRCCSIQYCESFEINRNDELNHSFWRRL